MKKFLCLFLLIGILLFGIPLDLYVPLSASASSSDAPEYYVFMLKTASSDIASGSEAGTEAMTLALTNIKTASGQTIPKSHITIVTDTELTGKNLSERIRRAFAPMKENDIGIFLYTGHGADSDGGALALYDGASFYYYPASELASTLKSLPGRFLVNIFACYSGGFISKANKNNLTLREDNFSEKWMTSFSSAENGEIGLNDRNKFYVLTSASGKELGWMGTVDTALAVYAGALGVSVGFIGDDDTVPRATAGFIADNNRDRILSFSEIADWTAQNTGMSNVQCYPQRCDDPLFSYDKEDPRGNPSVLAYDVEDQLVKAGGLFRMTFHTNDEDGANVSAFALNPNTLAVYDLTNVTTENLGSGMFRVTVSVPSATSGYSGFCVIRRSDLSPIVIPFIPEAEFKKPVFSIVETSPQPELIIPKSGLEYRIEVGYESSCLINVGIYNEAGEKVCTLAKDSLARKKIDRGRTTLSNAYYWDGTDDKGNPVPGGAYNAVVTGENTAGETTISTSAGQVKGIGFRQRLYSVRSGETVSMGTSDNLVNFLNQNAADSSLKWSSDNKKVVVVSSIGQVTAISPGIAYVTVQTADGKYMDSVPVVVYDISYCNAFDLILQVGNANALLDGKKISVDRGDVRLCPRVLGTKILVPLRMVGETMDATVRWNQDHKTAFVIRGEEVTAVTVGSTNLYGTYGVSEMLQPAILLSGSVYLPVRDVGEAVDCTVRYWSNTGGSFVFVSSGDISENKKKDLFQTGKEELEKYLPSSPANEIIFRVGNETATVNGQQISLNNEVVLQLDGKIYLPADFTAQAVGAKVEWSNWLRMMTIIGDDRVSVRIGRKEYVKNKVTLPSSAYPIIYNDLTYIPAEMCGEMLGLQVSINGNTVTLKSNS